MGILARNELAYSENTLQVFVITHLLITTNFEIRSRIDTECVKWFNDSDVLFCIIYTEFLHHFNTWKAAKV